MEPASFDINRFRDRLAETAMWCSLAIADTEALPTLRTSELRPPHGLETQVERNITPSVWTPDTTREYLRRASLEHAQVLCERQQILDTLVEQRRVLLSDSQRFLMYKESELDTKGRLLVYKPDGTASDGAARVSSHGFFDDDNVPPWDTWIDYVVEEIDYIHTYLLSWVPAPFVALADRGIEVNPEACILWVGQVEADFVRQMRDAGMIG